MKKRTILFGVAGVLVAVGGFFVWQIGPRNLVGMLLYDQRREGHLRVGDRVPDVVLVGLDGVSESRLGDWIGEQPLVVILGSFT